MSSPVSPRAGRIPRALGVVVRWFDNEQSPPCPADQRERINWLQAIPYLAMHVACLGVFFVGASWIAVATAIALYAIRMFAITGFYHRYFSHRTFRTSRACQFVFAVLGNSAVQRGPLWWAAHHRHHHRRSDRPDDAHSPTQRGLFWSHTLWFIAKGNFHTDLDAVRDLAKYRELRWLDRFDLVVPVLLAVSMFGFGALLERFAPGLGTNGWQMLVWGFFVSTVVVAHATFTINSLSHLFGRRRYATKDTSRNNWMLALLTLGEGWHNNHHHYCASTRQGFFWWEIDLTYYVLKAMSWVGLVHDLRPVPSHAKYAHRAEDRPATDASGCSDRIADSTRQPVG